MMVLAASALGADHPFLREWDTPFGAPPFGEIREEHFMPAFEEGMKQRRAQIDAITANPEPPTFENTIAALSTEGALLPKVSAVFWGLNSANTNDTIQKIAREVTPLLSKLSNEIAQNEKLFARIEKLYTDRSELGLGAEDRRLLEEEYKDFVRNGAQLSKPDKKRLSEINERLSMLSLEFGENILKEDNKFELVIEEKKDLSGLPENIVTKAAEVATERGHSGKWVFTLHKSSMIPFLQYSDRRPLREKIYTAYMNRCNHDDDLDNKALLTEMAALRAERSKLLGFETHADYILDENMAKTPKAVYEFLDRLWTPALAMSKREAAAMQKMIDAEGGAFQLATWDWWYYAEKVKQAEYALSDAMLRPYFQQDLVVKGAFDVARKLYGIEFVQRDDVPVYHEDVTVYEVKEADGTSIGLFYTDYYYRSSKRGGAWCSSFRGQSHEKGRRMAPLVINVCNNTKPPEGEPALMSLEEVETLFHEFGHALHSLFYAGTYRGLAGTPRDFVELPSQIMENWATEPDVMRSYAKHYETGETIPDALIEKIHKARYFNQGFETVEYLAASYLDMDWHTLTQAPDVDALKFEDRSMERIGLIPEIISRYRSYYFRHVFGGGYSSGYYSYIWAAVLDADAFEAFKETSLFDRDTARAFRKHVLSRGGTDEPMTLYKNFRGAEPKIEPLLKRRGLLQN